MDEYSKSGPRSAKAEQAKRERDMERRLHRLLSLETEEEFVSELKTDLGIDRKHPNYLRMIAIWRAKHP